MHVVIGTAQEHLPGFFGCLSQLSSMGCHLSEELCLRFMVVLPGLNSRGEEAGELLRLRMSLHFHCYKKAMDTVGVLAGP